MYKVLRNVTRFKLTVSTKIPTLRTLSVIPTPEYIFKRHTSSYKSDNVYLVDEDDSSGNETGNNINKYTQRTHTCGELRIDNVGQRVVLCGWLEFQRMNKFAVLRDSYGATQLLVPEEDTKTQKLLQNLPFESIIQVKGTVLSRPTDMKNKKQPTGDIEIFIEHFTVLNKAKDSLPFHIREHHKAKEALRMQYRYLDLRYPLMQRNLRVRSEMLMKMREFLVNHSGFVDVETPTLFKATPGGAQEFIVPTRFPGQFYSLVQSPQQFKQMLMAGAVDRYFQIARCYRDEGARPDRQPEFTQLDIEMSFTDLDNILQLVEELLGHAWPPFLGPLPKKFQRMGFGEAMELYGSDQPDTRFGFKLENCTELLKLNEKFINSDDFGAYCIVFPKEYANLNKGVKENLEKISKQFPLVKFVQTKVATPGELAPKLGKLLGDNVAAKLANHVSDDCVLFLGFGNKKQTQSLMGKVRLEYANHLEQLGVSVRAKGMHLLWVVDMPLFEPGESPGSLQSAHHPFTAPNPDDLLLLDTAPLQVRSLSFDLVLNGNEIGGGSVRIHDPDLQEKIFRMLNIDKNSMQHIIDMLSSGCPPHGGIALGLDRLMSKILNTASIRDVIAFPKTFEGRDPLSGAPSAVSDADLKLYHVKSVVE
ncbi:aspartate--tRNA ligase, mitochondrial [Tribolium castaneum]|uniref:Aspartate--tRNA ligase, mitochondrial-like Protein n=1 Tax=Tribolium castaneum TaxID=7070 RepID=D6WJB0_TRICA|nr:PREDICTED: aspartate--tRNA ligase, mitochondrial [Tribolium castaneum]EFA03147.2 Aspartate--tRNA ligase, mitochondrial-like Protein [Tribolium castaneum]|eukprot:XP_008194045.1 PREDICTED: aspartate--tRNA ligase, mitochondrial [Tribolium castaneum]